MLLSSAKPDLDAI